MDSTFPPRSKRRRLRRPRLSRAASRRIAPWAAGGLALAAALLVTLAGRTAKAAVAICVLSVFSAYVLAPAARRLRKTAHRRRRRLSPTAALAIVYLLAGTGAAIAYVTLGARVIAEAGWFGQGIASQVETAVQSTGSFERWQQWLGWSHVSTTTPGAVALWLSDWVRVHVAEVLTDALDYRWVLPWLALVPAISFLLLSQFATFRRSTLRVLPPGHVRWRGSELLVQVNGVLAGYVRAQAISALFVAAVSMAGFALLRVPYAFAMGAVAGVLEVVPLVGPIAVALLVVGLVEGVQLVGVLVFLGIVRVLQDGFLYPRLAGRGVHLPALGILSAVWIGATVGGILGVLLAVPVVGVGAVAFRQWRDYHQIEQLVRHHGRSEPLTVTEAGYSSGPDREASDGG
jgi:predicted PurR-regulated permease PerM